MIPLLPEMPPALTGPLAADAAMPPLPAAGEGGTGFAFAGLLEAALPPRAMPDHTNLPSPLLPEHDLSTDPLVTAGAAALPPVPVAGLPPTGRILPEADAPLPPEQVPAAPELAAPSVEHSHTPAMLAPRSPRSAGAPHAAAEGDDDPLGPVPGEPAPGLAMHTLVAAPADLAGSVPVAAPPAPAASRAVARALQAIQTPATHRVVAGATPVTEPIARDPGPAAPLPQGEAVASAPASPPAPAPPPADPHAVTPAPAALALPERVETARAAASAPQVESAIAQLGELREALRAVRPEMTLRHAEFGTVSLRLEQGAPDQWRAVLASRDPGFIPAIHAALADRAIAASGDASTHFAGHPGSGQQGTDSPRYGASPNGGQGSSQPYPGQSGGRDGEPAPDHRRPSTAAALAARAGDEDDASRGRAGGSDGMFA